MIPKRIIQVYVSDIPMPDIIKQNIILLKELNPTWNYKLFNEVEVREYIQQNGWPELIEQVNRIRSCYFVSIVDIFRYLILYKEGGIYLDIKATITKSLDSVLLPDDQFLIPSNLYLSQPRESIDNSVGELPQWFLMSAPNHPYVKSMLDIVIDELRNYQYKVDSVGEKGVFNVSGSGPYTRSIISMFNPTLHRIVELDAMGLQYTIFKKPNGHRYLFNPHYSTLTARIII